MEQVLDLGIPALLCERLRNVITHYQNRSIETKQFMEELAQALGEAWC
jgi:hypothetical protein